MLKILREKTKSLQWVLWLIIAAFVIWIVAQLGGAIGAGRSERQWAAVVGDRRVTADEFIEAYQRQEQTLRQLFGEQFDRARFMSAAGVLSPLVDRAILEQEAKRMGLTATQDEIAAAIRDIDAFRGPDGRFDRELYDDYLAASRTRAVEFEERLGRDLAVQKLEDLLRSACVVTDSEARAEWRDRNATATIEYLLFDPTVHADAVEVDEDELRARFDADPEAHDAGPGRLVRWAAFDRAAAQAGLEDVSEMQGYYEENKAVLYTMGPEQRRASRILVAVPDGAGDEEREAARREAADLAGRARAGEDFAELAREHSDDALTAAGGGDLGPFYAGSYDPAFDEAVFSMAEGEIAGPVETAAGFEVVLLTKGEGSKARPFEEVRDLVSRGLYAARAAEETRKALERFQAAFAESGDFAAAAESAGVAVQGPTWVTRETPADEGPGPAALARVFDMEVGAVSDAISVPGGLVVLAVDDERESTPRTFEQAREDVEAVLRREAAETLATAEAQAVLERLKTEEGTTLTEVAGDRSVTTAGPFRQGSSVPGLGAADDLNALAFEVEVGQVGPVVMTPRGPVLFSVTDRVELTEDAFAEERSALVRQLRDQRFRSLRSATVGRLRRELEEREEIVTNAALMARFETLGKEPPLG